MRLRSALPLIPILLTASCDFGATGSGDGGGAGPSSTQLTELSRSFTDDLESEAVTLTLTTPGAPSGIAFAGVCPDTSNTDDADDDGILDDAVLTFEGASCRSATWRGGAIEVTGEVRVIDPSQASSTAYQLRFTDLTWNYTNSSETLEYESVRNGRRSRTGNADSIVVESTDTTDRSRTSISAVARIIKDLTWRFGADDPDAIGVGEALPSGLLSVSGDWNWRRSSEDWEFAVTTRERLHYDATCVEPQKFTAGIIRLTGRVDGVDGFVTIRYTGCGENPTRTFTEN